MAYSLPQLDWRDVFMNLNDTVAQRKAEVREEARRKLAADLQLIPSPASKHTGRDAVQILPKEIWGLILDYLTDPKDIENVQGTCLLFKELLQRVYFNSVLLPKVLSLKPLERLLEVEVEPYIIASETVPLRLVCKQWRANVNKYFEEDCKKYWEISPDPELAPSHYVRGLFLPWGDQNKRVVDGMLADLSAVGQMQIFKRRLVLNVDDLHYGQDGNDDPALDHGELLTHFTKVTELLRAVGDQLWCFCLNLPTGFTCFECNITVAQAYLSLCEWVELMPELRMVEVNFGYRSRRFNFIFQNELELQEAIRTRPFPELPKLVHFFVRSYVPEVDAYVWSTVLDANPHLKHVSLNFDDYTDGDKPKTKSFFEKVRSLPQLESICLQSSSSLGRLCPLIMSQNWCLRKVELIGSETDIAKLFRFLENFQTLECLQIGFERGWGENPGFLQLPNLTHLNYVFGLKRYHDSVGPKSRKTNAIFEVDCAIQRFSVDFLFPLKKLESLVWRTLDEARPREKFEREIIMFNGGHMNLYKSNIWDVLPKLKLVVVEHQYHERLVDFDVDTGSAGQTIYRRSDRNKPEKNEELCSTKSFLSNAEYSDQSATESDSNEDDDKDAESDEDDKDAESDKDDKDAKSEPDKDVNSP